MFNDSLARLAVLDLQARPVSLIKKKKRSFGREYCFKIKNPNFMAGFKNMTKLMRGGIGWQWSSL